MKKFLAMIVIVCFIITGCASTHPFKSGVMTTPDTTPMTVKQGGKTAVVKFGDATGHGLDFSNNLREKLQAKGLTLITDESKADYIVDCKLTFIDVAEKHPDGSAILAGAGLGALAGGILAYNNNLVNWQAGLVGLGVGLLVAGTATAIERANRQVPYIGVMGVTIKQKLDFVDRVKPIEEPIVNKTKITETITDAKGVKKTTITEREVAKTETPVQTKKSIAKSGTGNYDVTTQTAVAKYETHQTELKAVVVARGANHSVDMVVNDMSNYLASSLASNF